MTVPATEKPPTTDAEITAYIRSAYGYLAGFLAIPEIKKVLFDAAKGGWDMDRIRGALYATSWWKKTSETARQWDALASLDPASAASKMQAATHDIGLLAKQLGVSVNSDAVKRLAVNVNRLGWTDQQVREALAGQWHFEQQPHGQAAVSVGSLRQLASAYALDISDNALQTWTRRILSGVDSLDSFRADLAGKAKSFYNSPDMTAAIDAGQTVRDYADQYVQRAVKWLNVNPDAIDLTDPKWRRALATVDPKSGMRMPMSLDQWDTELRTNPLYGYDRTANGRQAGASFVTELAKQVGQAP